MSKTTERIAAELLHDKNHEELINFPGVLNTVVGNKITDGKDTGEISIIFLVSKKKKLRGLKVVDRIPPTYRGVLTDVQELSSKDFDLGPTDASKMRPSDQKKLLGVMK